jgi:hypothetical protein
VGVHILFLVLYVSLSGTIDAVTMSGLLIAHCFVNLSMDIIRKDKRGVYIMTTYNIGILLTTFANLSYINNIYTFGLSENSMYKYIIIEYIEQATLIWVIGNASIFFGYELFSKNSLPSISIEIKNRNIIDKYFNYIIGFALISLSGNIINFSFISGGIQKVLGLFSVMGILFYARLWGKEGIVKYRNYAVLLAVLQTITALYNSFLRIDLLTPSIIYYGGYFVGKGSLKSVLSAKIIPPLLILIIFSQFFNTLAGNRAHFIDTFRSSGNDYETQNSYADLSEDKNSRGGLLERSSNIAQITNVVDLVERKGLYLGEASAPLVAALVPRFLWPDKPQIQLGSWFALEIGAATVSDITGRANNSINMTVPGELYLDFGWIGVVLGGLLFGGLVAMFWNSTKFNESAYNITGALWGGYLLLFALFGIGADLQIAVTLLSTYLTFFLIKKLARSYEGILSRTSVAR